MNWFTKLLPAVIRTDSTTKKSIPEGLWTSCNSCKEVLYRSELERNQDVCLKCGHHMRIRARKRLEHFLDPEGRTEIGANVTPEDFLKFKDLKRYKDRLIQAQKDTDETDALIAIRGQVNSIPLVACAFEFDFIGGTMGSVVGERFFQAANTCLEHNIPLV